MALSRFAGFTRAIDFAYGINPTLDALTVDLGPYATGSVGITLEFGQVTLSDGTKLSPLSTNAPITVGAGSASETVTPSAVSNLTPSVYDSAVVTATWANAHGKGDPVASGSVGLQEAINYTTGRGGGFVVIDNQWTLFGGTTAMIQAAILPNSAIVVIDDQRGSGISQFWVNGPTGAAISAPSAATSATVASLTAVGTWTATTIHVQFTYVDAQGGETAASADYSFTATATVAIGGSGPAAATGAVGYRVYIGTTAWLAPVTSANGTVIQCGPLAAFAIGTSFSIATATTSALAIVPGIGTAFACTPIPTLNLPQPFRATWLPGTNQGTIASGTASTVGMVQLPAGYLNYIGRGVRLTGTIVATTNNTSGTLTLNALLHSVYGVTSITPFTAITTAQGASALSINLEFTIELTTSKVGATGTLEVHGRMFYNVAGTTGVGTISQDLIHAASSAIDLTKQDVLELTVTPTTTGTTALTLRQLFVEPIF